MDYNEFAARVKSVHPEYADMDNKDLATKMVAKFPQYNDVTFGPSQDVTSNPLYKSNPDFKQDASYQPIDTDPIEQRIVENLGVAGTGYGVGQLAGNIVKGAAALPRTTLGRAILNSPEALGPEFRGGEKAAGISGDLPLRRGGTQKFPDLAGQPSLSPPVEAPMVAPLSYAKDTNSFLNQARARVQAFGDKLSPQELNDYKTELSNILGSTPPGTPQYAIASQLKTDVTALHNTAIPGREQLNAVYGLSKTLHPDIGGMVSTLIKKVGWLPVKIALGTAGAKGIENLFKANQ